jgi:hypothetical protein
VKKSFVFFFLRSFCCLHFFFCFSFFFRRRCSCFSSVFCLSALTELETTAAIPRGSYNPNENDHSLVASITWKLVHVSTSIVVVVVFPFPRRRCPLTDPRRHRFLGAAAHLEWEARDQGKQGDGVFAVDESEREGLLIIRLFSSFDRFDASVLKKMNNKSPSNPHSQDAHKRALELGDKARKEFDLEAEAKVRRKSFLRRKKRRRNHRRRFLSFQTTAAAVVVVRPPLSLTLCLFFFFSLAQTTTKTNSASPRPSSRKTTRTSRSRALAIN